MPLPAGRAESDGPGSTSGLPISPRRSVSRCHWSAPRVAIEVAAHRGDRAFVEALARKGADMRAKDKQHYDIITIASVRDDS